MIGTMLWFIPVPVFGVSMIYKIVLGVGVLAAALTVGALIYSVLGWKRGYWGIYARVHYTLATLAGLAFVWFLNYWNLLGWQFLLADVSKLAGVSSVPCEPTRKKRYEFLIVMMSATVLLAGACGGSRRVS